MHFIMLPEPRADVGRCRTRTFEWFILSSAWKVRSGRSEPPRIILNHSPISYIGVDSGANPTPPANPVIPSKLISSLINDSPLNDSVHVS